MEKKLNLCESWGRPIIPLQISDQVKIYKNLWHEMRLSKKDFD